MYVVSTMFKLCQVHSGPLTCRHKVRLNINTLNACTCMFLVLCLNYCVSSTQ